MKGGARGVGIFVDLQEMLSYSTIYNLSKRDKSTKHGKNLAKIYNLCSKAKKVQSTSFSGQISNVD